MVTIKIYKSRQWSQKQTIYIFLQSQENPKFKQTKQNSRGLNPHNITAVVNRQTDATQLAWA